MSNSGDSDFPESAAETTRPDLPPITPGGHLNVEKLGGHDLPGMWDESDYMGGETYHTVEDPPASDEPTDELETGAHRKLDVNKKAAILLPIGVVGLGLAFWGIHSASASGPEVASQPHTAVESAEPTSMPGPTVTHTVRGPRVVVTKTARARVTVRVTATATRWIRLPPSPAPTVTKTVTKCPSWGCDG